MYLRYDDGGNEVVQDYPRALAPNQEQLAFQKLKETSDEAVLSSYAIFIAGNSSGIFTAIKMDSTGSFVETRPDDSELQ